MAFSGESEFANLQGKYW